jgi:glutathione S-transferase
MLLIEKGVTDYAFHSVNLMDGAQKSAVHLARHPFGRVPVVDVDGFRVIETQAITRFLDAVLPGPALVPAEAKDAARMDMAVSILNSYGYEAMVLRVAGYHLFPEFTGGKDEDKHRQGLADAHQVIGTLMGLKGASPYIAGGAISIADLYLAPIFDYVAMTPHKDEFLGRADFGTWWSAISGRDSFKSTPFGEG